jgi:mRNA-degrading endonuclease RelE of RelBE toxin-antitoxin system
MAVCSVRLLKSAEAELMALPFPLRRQVNHAIVRLKEDPLPEDSEPLGGGRFRLVVHGRRILYRFDEAVSAILIVAIR